MTKGKFCIYFHYNFWENPCCGLLVLRKILILLILSHRFFFFQIHGYLSGIHSPECPDFIISNNDSSLVQLGLGNLER